MKPAREVYSRQRARHGLSSAGPWRASELDRTPPGHQIDMLLKQLRDLLMLCALQGFGVRTGKARQGEASCSKLLRHMSISLYCLVTPLGTFRTCS